MSDYILTNEDCDKLNKGLALTLPKSTTRIITSSWWCDKCKKRILAGIYCGHCNTKRVI